MKRISLVRITAYFAVALLGLSMAHSSQKTITLGGEGGWNNLQVMDGVTTGKGRFGFDSLELVTKTPAVDGGTDLLLDFDGNSVTEMTGRYDILENHLVLTKDAVKGKGAALSRGVSKGIILTANEKSLAGSSGLAGSFTVEFWLCPSLAENGEKVYTWRTSMNYSNYSEYQNVSAVFVNNRLEWKFKNVFPSFSESDVVLKGFSAVVPGEWSRHTISFDEESGCLEYLVDGRTEAVKYITSTGHERGTVCMPVLGLHSILEICPSYTGKIDNVRIQRSACQNDGRSIFADGNETFKTSGGRFVTQPVLVSQAAVLDELDSIMSLPSQTEVKFYVRSGDNCWGWTEDYPEWKEVIPGEKIEGVSGLYFQVAADLLPDGNGTKTPGITQVTLKYTEAELPLPPFTVRAEPGDGQVTLSWSYSVDDCAGGYYVYYGSKPGEYLGRAAVEGASPVRAGNRTSITLTGLNNGTIYYFAVSAYSRVDGRITGELSKEVFARPSKRLVRK